MGECRATPGLVTIFGGPKKKKPGGGNAGSIFSSYRSLRFQYAAWLLLVTPKALSGLLLLSSQIFFLFFYFLVLL
jgi:hypothetical protein